MLAVLVGHWELVVVMVIILLLFGSRVPALMRSVGQGVRELKKGLSGVGEEIESAAKEETDEDTSYPVG